MSRRASKPGRTGGLGLPEGQQWAWMTTAMLGSLTYRALGISARRILDFLLFEHAAHGGKENGNLGATYRQLEAWGVTAADVRKGFAELYAAGFVELTRQGARQAGGGEPSRYALSWLPTFHGSAEAAPPTHMWSRITTRLQREGRYNLQGVRAWMREQTADHKRREVVARKSKLTPHLQVVSPINCEARKAR